MALWPKKEEAPNVQPDQSKEQMDALVTQLRTSFEETLKPVREQLSAYESRFASIEQKVTKPIQTEPTEVADIDLDPDGWRRQNLEPLAAGIATLSGRFAERDAIESLREQGYDHLIPQVQEVFAKMTTPATKAMDTYGQYCDNVINLAIGKDARASGLRRDSSKKTYFIESEGAGGNSEDRSRQTQIEELANDGKIDILKKSGGDVSVWAKKMGIKDVNVLLEN